MTEEEVVTEAKQIQAKWKLNQKLKHKVIKWQKKP